MPQRRCLAAASLPLVPEEEVRLLAITIKTAFEELERIIGDLEDSSQVCSIRPSSEEVVCPARQARSDLLVLRTKLRETLVAMGSRSDLQGHNIAPWPETERLKRIAAKCGDRTADELRAQCEEMAGKIDMTPGDALDYVAELVGDEPEEDQE